MEAAARALRDRIIVGGALALGVIGAVSLDGYLSAPGAAESLREALPVALRPWVMRGAICTLIVLIMTVLTSRELLVFARLLGYKPFGRIALLFSAGLVAGPYIETNMRTDLGENYEGWALLWITCALGASFFIQAARHRTEHAMENIASTLFIIVYAGGCAGFVTKLRIELGGAAGAATLLFSILVIKITDTGAFFTGRLLGRNKMIPWLSAKKTWEGFVGGLVTAMLVSVGVGLLLHHAGLLKLPSHFTTPLGAVLTLAAFGLVMALFSVAGDLFASLLKRDAHVKDSSDALPGLGGVLDVFDSPLLAAPPAWFFWLRVTPLIDSF